MEINLLKLKEYGQLLTVLYVEDDDKLREQTTIFLKKFFENVDIAINGKDGWSKYQSNNYDIVITDIVMPEMNGIQLIYNIRNYKPEQVVIATSAYTESHYFIELINMGVDRFLLKPIDNKPFVSTLYKVSSSIFAKKDNERLNIESKKNLDLILAILEEMGTAIVVRENREIAFANKRFFSLIGVNDIQDFKQKYNNLYSIFLNVKNYFHKDNDDDIVSVLLIEGEQKVVIEDKNRENHKRIFSLSCSTLSNGSELFYLHDITDIEKDILLFRKQLQTNPYTGLPNKIGIFEDIASKITKLENLSLVLCSIKNLERIVKYHGKEGAQEAEKTAINRIIEKCNNNFEIPLFFGNFDKNSFIIGATDIFTARRIQLLIEELSISFIPVKYIENKINASILINFCFNIVKVSDFKIEELGKVLEEKFEKLHI